MSLTGCPGKLKRFETAYRVNKLLLIFHHAKALMKLSLLVIYFRGDFGCLPFTIKSGIFG